MKIFLTAGIISAGLAVISGAFGAHSLKARIPVEQLQVFETAVRYQLYHSIALIIIFLLNNKLNTSLLNISGWLFFLGIILFSGSLYLLSCRELIGIDNWKSILGPVTPLGGLCFIAGWICLAIVSIKL